MTVSLVGSALAVAPNAVAQPESAPARSARPLHDVAVAGGPSGGAAQKPADRLGRSPTTA
ncbi:hypothetical protein [Streptomyces sp. NPDC001435]|uniref:hypothetical protein n=1 Tax=unclassified Streptomyces TaxID=2593676 RepID=UPI00369E3F95